VKQLPDEQVGYWSAMVAGACYVAAMCPCCNCAWSFGAVWYLFRCNSCMRLCCFLHSLS
jgi:hypothetical protein